MRTGHADPPLLSGFAWRIGHTGCAGPVTYPARPAQPDWFPSVRERSGISLTGLVR